MLHNNFPLLDLIEMIPYYRINKGYRYILCCINVFSKKVYLRKLQDKNTQTVSKAMKNIIETVKSENQGKAMKNLQSDHGGEFVSKAFKIMLKPYNINFYQTYSSTKACVCERVIRTLKGFLWKIFDYQGNFNWIIHLEKLEDFYNNRYHRTIKMSPNEVNKSNEQEILRTVYRFSPRLAKPKYKVGDSVRISKERMVFSKGYRATFSSEVFTIHQVLSTTPITYKITDLNNRLILGCFYEPELLKVKTDLYLVEKVLKRKKGLSLVKFKGYKDSYWIKNTDII